MSKINFRLYVPAPEKSKIVGETSRQHANTIVKKDIIISLFDYWRGLFGQQFKGITTNGLCQKRLFSIRPENAPTEAAINASINLLNKLSANQKHRACFDVHSKQWRNWQNTEIFIEEHGLRLDEVESSLRNAVMQVMKASLSDDGYQKTHNVMRLNRFLGDLVGGQASWGSGAIFFACLDHLPRTSPGDGSYLVTILL